VLRNFAQAVAGIATLVIPGCRADSINVASISGMCIPSLSVTSFGPPVSVFESQTCFPNSVDDREMASADASAGSLRISGEGIVSENATGVSALASYSEEIVVTGPESGSGTLLISFATTFTGSPNTGFVNTQFAPSFGSGGVSFQCSGGGPPCSVPPTVVDFAIPFTYGVPFGYTISFSAQAESGESFQFSDSAILMGDGGWSFRHDFICARARKSWADARRVRPSRFVETLGCGSERDLARPRR
jgi:hypothetical protein